MHSCPDHDELRCHRTGERRENLLNKLKEILANADDTPCTSATPRPRPFIKFPGYLDKKHPCLSMTAVTAPCQTATLSTKYYIPKNAMHKGGCCLSEEEMEWSGEVDDVCLRGNKVPTHVYDQRNCTKYPLLLKRDDSGGCNCSLNFGNGSGL